MGPYLPRVQRECSPLIGLSIRLGLSCEARTNQRLANGIGVSKPCGAVSTRKKLGFLPRLVDFLGI